MRRFTDCRNQPVSPVLGSPHDAGEVIHCGGTVLAAAARWDACAKAIQGVDQPLSCASEVVAPPHTIIRTRS
jgi:hypothetical protein